MYRLTMTQKKETDILFLRVVSVSITNMDTTLRNNMTVPPLHGDLPNHLIVTNSHQGYETYHFRTLLLL